MLADRVADIFLAGLMCILATQVFDWGVGVFFLCLYISVTIWQEVQNGKS